MTLPPYEYIDTPGAWRQCLTRLRKESRLAVDVEANSLYAYRERVCLFQVSIPDHDYIIDPLAELDLAPLGKLIANPAVQKVFHCCEYDLMLLNAEYGWRIRNLFDTMWAGRLLGHTHMGLAAFLKAHFDVDLSKRHQKANWGRRPLPEKLLAYAQKDTHYLLDLCDELEAQLEIAGLREEAQDIFDCECVARTPDRAFRPDGFWSIRGVRGLNSRERAIFKELYVARDREARRRDWPPFKVMSNEAMLTLAREAPTHFNDVKQVRGISKRLSSQFGTRLLKAIARGKKARPPKEPPKPPRQRRDVSARYKALFAWRKAVAEERGVESDVIMSRETLWEIARLNPKTPADLKALNSLGPYRRKRYADAVLEALR